jgi:hypothetical protein
MRSPSVRTLGAAAVTLLLALGACFYDNPHGSQGLAPVTRLSTYPVGATVSVPQFNLQLVTPCDLDERVTQYTELEVRKDGYATWRGTLGDIPQVAQGSYELRLSKQ